ncbi:MAG: 4-hydroxy-tetrahydrodipicolinate synthase, partial [Clostridia bacterium]|nr:4-hydroxy-tetrahydrodipicolinate synthase [Clostridia bacterium]
VTPYYNKCTQKGLIAHYTAVANAISIPVILYNVPARTGVNILPSTALELSKVKNIVAIKEASGNIDQLMTLCRLVEGKMDVYLGEDALTYVGMTLGAKGVISVVANVVPKLMSDIPALCNRGEWAKAREIQFRLAELTSAMFCEVNPIPVKMACSYLGYGDGSVRLPLTVMEDQNAERLYNAMRELNLV